MWNSYVCNPNNEGRQSIEHELYNQVSNVVSSFLSKYDTQKQHLRGKSKSDLGFINSNEYGSIDACNDFENDYNEPSIYNQRNQSSKNNILKEYNGCRDFKERWNSNCREQNQLCKNSFLIN